MLVLTRKPGQSIIIGDNIEITISEVSGDQVRIGINAPKEISIHRKEIYLEIEDENKKAAQSNVKDLGEMLKKLKDKHLM